MRPIYSIAKNVIADRRGVTALEYGIICGVLAVGLVAAFQALTGKLTNGFNALTI